LFFFSAHSYAEHFEPNPSFWLIVVILLFCEFLRPFSNFCQLPLSASPCNLSAWNTLIGHIHSPQITHTLEHTTHRYTERLLGLRPRFWANCGPTVSSVSGLWVTFLWGSCGHSVPGGANTQIGLLAVGCLDGWLVESSTHNKIMQILGSAAYNFRSSIYTHTHTHILRPTHFDSFSKDVAKVWLRSYLGFYFWFINWNNWSSWQKPGDKVLNCRRNWFVLRKGKVLMEYSIIRGWRF